MSTIKKWFANARDVSVAQSLLPSVLAVVLAISTQDFCSASDYDFGAALNKLMDVLDVKVKKEKEKAQEKK